MIDFFQIAFAILCLIWGGRFVYQQTWRLSYKVVGYFLISFLGFAILNRPLAGQWGMSQPGTFIAFLASVGVVFVGNWAHGRWGANARAAVAIVIASLLFIAAFLYPVFVAGPGAITPSIPTIPSPVVSAPTTPAPAPSARTTPQRRVHGTFDMADCPNVSYEFQKDMGCPGVE